MNTHNIDEHAIAQSTIDDDTQHVHDDDTYARVTHAYIDAMSLRSRNDDVNAMYDDDVVEMIALSHRRIANNRRIARRVVNDIMRRDVDNVSRRDVYDATRAIIDDMTRRDAKSYNVHDITTYACEMLM